jgi:hypothetical protein
MLAYSSSPQASLRLSSHISTSQQGTATHIVVQIRDLLQCVIDYHLPPVYVRSDPTQITQLIDDLTRADLQSINRNPIIQLLATRNPNVIGQVLTSISQIFNQINTENIDQAVSSRRTLIPRQSISCALSVFVPRWGSGCQYLDPSTGK